MSTRKDAARDAEEFARAQMFYGEGAGTRRKLIQATVDSKINRDPAYGRAFRDALSAQDMAEHASKARKERSRKDTSKAVEKNLRGILTGKNQSVNTSILVLGAVVYYAHQTGIDKKVADAVKKKRRQFKNWRMLNKISKNLDHNVYHL